MARSRGRSVTLGIQEDISVTSLIALEALRDQRLRLKSEPSARPRTARLRDRCTGHVPGGQRISSDRDGSGLEDSLHPPRAIPWSRHTGHNSAASVSSSRLHPRATDQGPQFFPWEREWKRGEAGARPFPRPARHL
jgi:hypothetical protein